ncbi:hypothetical protein [Amycolatopsis sp. NPDC051903]|uniref:hypothetical protein n=1 Tax=Amycolatopsis sp. NPDC051903 TaxID=3363936 RepID=UPI0037A026D6
MYLHALSPDSPLPRDGEPYPDDRRHRGRNRPRPPEDLSLLGVEPAGILAEHFANPASLPHELADTFDGKYVPSYPNPHISAVVARTDPARARATGRWLVLNGTDRFAMLIGLAALVVVGTPEDIPLLRTIGLLSDKFAHLAARALERLAGGTAALCWLADRVDGWGRVYVVEALVRLDDPAGKPWLLRRAVNGDFLNGYFAGRLAVDTALHEAIADPTADDELVDHTGRLLVVLTYCDGMGISLHDYAHAVGVLDVHARRWGGQQPTARRFATAAVIADYLRGAARLGWPQAQRDRLRDAYRSVLDREDWCAVIRRAVSDGDEHLERDYLRWLATEVGPRLGLRAFFRHPGDD